MNKKFLNLFLIGALTVGFAGLAVSCKDYDDDIDALNVRVDGLEKTVNDLQAKINAGAVISSVVPSASGIKVTLSDGTSYDITNGKDGANGKDGVNGTNGKDGKDGQNGKDGSVITIGENGNWFIDGVDTGKPSQGAAGADGKDGVDGKDGAAGADGKDGANAPTIYYKPGADGKWIKVTINPGEEPVEEATGESCFPEGTLTAVWDEASNTLLIYNAEGHAEPIEIGATVIRSISYRKQAKDDENDVVTSYLIYKTVDGEKVPFANAPGVATFKVCPESFDMTKAAFAFNDTYALTKAVDPAFSVFGTPALEKGILTVGMVPNAGVEVGKVYATEFEITLNGNSTGSDYFKAAADEIDAATIKNVHLDGEGAIDDKPAMEPNSGVIDGVDVLEFAFDKDFDLAPVFSAALKNNKFLKDENIAYEQSFSLVDDPENKEVNWVGLKKAVKPGVFEVKDGVLSVVDKQPSAITEYAVIKITTTVKATLPEAEDYEVVNYVAFKAVRAAAPADPEKPANPLYLLAKDGPEALVLNYNADKPQVVELDVRTLVNKVGGKDKLVAAYPAADGKFYDLVFKVFAPVVDEEGNITGYKSLSNRNFDRYKTTAFNPENPEGVNGEAYVVYANTRENADDKMYLVIGPKAKLAEGTYYVGVDDECSRNEIRKDAPVEVIDGIKWNPMIEGLAVGRKFEIDIFEEFASRVIIGKIGDNGKFLMQSENFLTMYEYSPSDAEVSFVIKPELQSEDIAQYLEDGDLTFEDYTISLKPKKDLKTISPVKVTIKDGDEELPEPEVWNFQDPVKTLAWNVDATLPTLYQPKLKDGVKVTFADWSQEKFLKKITLKDRYGDDLLEGTKTGITVKLANRYDMSVSYALDPKDANWEIDSTTGDLTCKIASEGSEYKATIHIQITIEYNWGKKVEYVALPIIRNTQD